jgi:hypothetical protein
MIEFLKTIRDLFKKGKFTTNNDAANIIRKFANGTSSHPYEWDDFETQNEENPEADIALELCWYFANKYPANQKTQYCGEIALAFFLKIADALEKNRFHGLDYEKIRGYLKSEVLPAEIVDILRGDNSIKDSTD